MPYNPEQPRDIIGQWRDSNMTAGKHEVVDRWGRSHTYFVNEMGKLSTGSTLLGVAAKGRVMSSIKDDTPEERVHLMNDQDGNLMAVAASNEGVFAVVNESRPGPEEPMSITRGNRFQPTSMHIDDLDEKGRHHTEYGGRAAKMAERSDGKTYDTLSVYNAQKDNETAFRTANREAGNVHENVSPAELAEKTVAARHAYMQMGLTEGQARNREVMVYFDHEGNLNVEPAAMLDAENNQMVAALPAYDNPSYTEGSGVATVRLGQLTTMSRAMQAEHLNSVDMAISSGTQVDMNGQHMRNALHFQADTTNARSGDSIRVWGTVEQGSEGAYRRRSGRERDYGGLSWAAQQKAKHQAGTDELRRRGMRDPEHPANEREMAQVLSVRRGVSVSADGIHRVKEHEWSVPNEHGDQRYDSSGEFLGWGKVNDSFAARIQANMYHQGERSFRSRDVEEVTGNRNPKYASFIGNHRTWLVSKDDESILVRDDGKINTIFYSYVS